MGERTNRFREAWSRSLGDARLPADLDRLALVIALAARADGTRAVASNQWLADRLGISISTAQRRVKALKDAGWIDRTEIGRRRGDGSTTANVYELRFPSTGHRQVDD